MPRNPKCRRVCAVPCNRVFLPQRPFVETVTVTVEELEAVRLCDLERMEQDDAAASMNVSRGTFQRTLYLARKKIADALCGGKAIRIAGGDYELAQRPCGCRGKCRRCRFDSGDSPAGQPPENNREEHKNENSSSD